MHPRPLAARSILGAVVSVVLMIVAPITMAADSDPWTQKGSALSGSYNGAVALSGEGDVVAVGYPGDPNRGSAYTVGEVRAYAWSSVGWVQRGAAISGAVTYGFLGEAVALSDDGSTLVVGAPGYCDSFYGSGRLGAVRTYGWNATSSSWEQRGEPLSGVANFDCFGKTVALSDDGTKLAVGSPGVDGAGGPNSGLVTMYQWTGGAWVSVRTIAGSSGDAQFGAALSFNGAGTRLAVGTYNYDGRARVFDVSAESSSQVGSTIEGQNGQGWGVGKALALDDTGDVLAVGAEGWSTQRGRVTVYTLAGGVWTPRGAALDGEATYDRSGESLALSGDGLSVAIGAPNNNAGAGSEGHTRVYRWSGSAWVQRGGDIDGLAYQNSAGTWVAIDDAGVNVASNLNYADSGVGQVRVYSRPSAPGRPRDVGGTPGNGSVTVTWSAPTSDGGRTITGYTASAGTGESCTVTSVAPSTPATNCTITGLTNGASYTFRVTATNAEGTSVASVASAAVTPVAPVAPVESVPVTAATPSTSAPTAVTKPTAAATRTGGNVTVVVAVPTASIGKTVVILRKVGKRFVAVSTTTATSSALTIPLNVKGRPGSTQLRVVVGGKVIKSLKV